MTEKKIIYVKIVDSQKNVIAISGPYWVNSLDPNENQEIELAIIETGIVQ